MNNYMVTLFITTVIVIIVFIFMVKISVLSKKLRGVVIIKNMNIKTIYQLILIFPDKSNLKDIFSKILEDELSLLEFNDICEFEINLSTDQYINKLYNTFFEASEKGYLIIKVIINWWDNKYKSDKFIMECCMKNEKSLFWLNCILTGEIQKYFVQKYGANNNMILVDENEYKDLKKSEMSLMQLKQKQLHYKQSIKESFNNSTKNQGEQLNKLREENKILKEKLECEFLKCNKIIKDNKKLNARLNIVNKSILILGQQWGEANIDFYKEKYKLKSLKCYSALKTLNWVDDISSDYTIFCTDSAKHSVYRKVKNRENSFFHTTKTNLQTIFNEFIEYIQRRDD